MVDFFKTFHSGHLRQMNKVFLTIIYVMNKLFLGHSHCESFVQCIYSICNVSALLAFNLNNVLTLVVNPLTFLFSIVIEKKEKLPPCFFVTHSLYGDIRRLDRRAQTHTHTHVCPPCQNQSNIIRKATLHRRSEAGMEAL